MQKLKAKHKAKVQHYAESVNTMIQDMKSKKLYAFMIINMPYIDDYHVDYISNTDSLKDAEDLEDILFSGMKDLINIAAEDGLGIREYDTKKERNSKLIDVCEVLEEKYPSFVAFEVLAPITKTIKKLEIKGKADTSYYKALKTVKKKIDSIRKILKTRHAIQSDLRALEWKFIKIITAVGLTKIENGISTYKDVERLEKEAGELCRKIVSKTKKHDRKIETLTFLKA